MSIGFVRLTFRVKPPLTLTLFNSIGTSSIVDENTHEPILSILTLIVETAAKLHRDGHNVVIVSSGAVGVGLRRMDINERPKCLPRIQVELFLKKPLFTTLHSSSQSTGFGRCRSMSTYEPLGQFVWASSSSYCTNTPNKK